MNFDYRGIPGFDLSTWQDSPLVAGHVDFAKMFAWGARFVIIRAGQGNWIDDDFRTNWANAKWVLPRASYWYYDNHYDPHTQAQTYYEAIKDDPEGICWLDLEDRSGGTWSGYKNWYDFIVHLQSLMPGVKIGIYTSYYYWVEMNLQTLSGNLSWFAQFPLWLASYPADPFNPYYPDILIPNPWDECLILQSGTPGIGLEVGVESRDIDYNHFNGGEEKFKNFFLVPASGGPMTEKITGTAVVNVLLRMGPSTSYPGVEWAGRNYIPKNASIEAIPPAEGGKWLHISKINGVDVPVTAWSNAGAEQQYISWQLVTVPDTEPEPDPEPPPDFIEAHWVGSGKVQRYVPE